LILLVKVTLKSAPYPKVPPFTPTPKSAACKVDVPSTIEVNIILVNIFMLPFHIKIGVGILYLFQLWCQLLNLQQFSINYQSQ
jgi:hypothetical protein